MQVVNIKKQYMVNSGYRDLEDWLTDTNHIYIGRNLVIYVKGAYESKWHNPYSIKKYGLDQCLQLYEKHIRTSDLYHQLDELEDKVLGCWCHPKRCHGDILCSLLKEKRELVTKVNP